VRDGHARERRVDWSALLGRYIGWLRWALLNRYFVALASIGVLALALIIAATRIPFNLFGHVDVGQFFINAEAPNTYSLEDTARLAAQMEQVILNLVLNAEAAMADGAGGLRRLTIETAEPTPGTVEVWVRDTGGGVKEGDLENIFKPFVSTKASGLGLGLSISRSIVEAHGGTIRAERNAAGGLSVHVKLPCGAGP